MRRPLNPKRNRFARWTGTFGAFVVTLDMMFELGAGGSRIKLTLSVAVTALMSVSVLASSPVLGAVTVPSRPPTVRTTKPSLIEPTLVILAGTINPHGQPVRYWMEFGTRSASERRTRLSEETILDKKPVEVEEVAESLRPGMTYKYRVVATYMHRAKKVYGKVRSFTTNCYYEGARGETVLRPCLK
jgi:hypothetical protein